MWKILLLKICPLQNQFLNNFEEVIAKKRFSSFSTFWNFCPRDRVDWIPLRLLRLLAHLWCWQKVLLFQDVQDENKCMLKSSKVDIVLQLRSEKTCQKYSESLYMLQRPQYVSGIQSSSICKSLKKNNQCFQRFLYPQYLHTLV